MVGGSDVKMGCTIYWKNFPPFIGPGVCIVYSPFDLLNYVIIIYVNFLCFCFFFIILLILLIINFFITCNPQ